MIADGTRFGLMHLDLDYFKPVNDSYGHAAGDAVLATIARRLMEQTRAGDTVARIGGDEFVVALQGLEAGEALSAVAERIIARLEEPIAWRDVSVRVSASIGITHTGYHARASALTLLHDADVALYEAKRAGRGRHCHARLGSPYRDRDAGPAAGPSCRARDNGTDPREGLRPDPSEPG
jgi:diguanylate cyclase (GGDEF)-like protein